MHAAVGDRLHIHTSHKGSPDQYGQIVEIRGTNGAPPYMVEFLDGHTRLVFPGPDAVIEASQPAGGRPAPATSRSRRVHTRVGW